MASISPFHLGGDTWLGYLGDNDFLAILGSPHGHQLVIKALAHGVLLRPGACCGLVLGPIGLVHVGNLRHQRVVGVRVRQQRAD